MTQQPLPFEIIEREVHLKGGRIITVSREFETVIAEMTHKVRPKQGKPHTATDKARGATLDDAVIAVLGLTYHNDESRLVVNYVRSTEWGQSFP